MFFGAGVGCLGCSAAARRAGRSCATPLRCTAVAAGRSESEVAGRPRAVSPVDRSSSGKRNGNRVLVAARASRCSSRSAGSPRASTSSSCCPSRGRCPLSYFKGLNFLMNEQPDKAIEAFIEVVKVDPQTIELHFALGSLFRRRGEVERAIRMHQNLVERADLASEQKLMALFELAQDYFKAGLLDRAEELFLKLEGTTTMPSRRCGSCSRSTSRRKTGTRRSASPASSRRSSAARTRRKSPTSTASWRSTR